jgi:hypothetical protein
MHLQSHSFIKGIGLGVLAGAALTCAVVPMDRKKLMHTPVGKTFQAVNSVVDDVRDAF